VGDLPDLTGRTSRLMANNQQAAYDSTLSNRLTLMSGAPTMSDIRFHRPILVTGASTGIGRAATVRLAGLGHPVFATARRSEDLEQLGSIRNVTPIRLDVRSPADVTIARNIVQDAGMGLYAVVNNAGVGGIGPIASFTDEEVRDLFEINVFGVVRLTRAFLPLLLESGGRAIIVGSMGGSISMKYYAPYTMTKHAMEAFVTALDLEIRPHGARAAIIQPGAVATAIFETTQEADRQRFLRAPAPFDQEAREVLAGFDDDGGFDPTQPESATNRKLSPPEAVADAIQMVLDAPDPPLRTLVGTRWEGNRVLDALLQRVARANDCPSLGYTRAELVERFERFL